MHILTKPLDAALIIGMRAKEDIAYEINKKFFIHNAYIAQKLLQLLRG